MAHRRRSRNISRRDPLPIANPRLPAYKFNKRTISDLRGIEDLRLFHPVSHRFPISTVRRSDPVIKARNARSQAILSSPPPRPHFAFNAPDSVLVCVRRKRRKEVLHAFGRTGSRGQRRPRFNSNSSISCKG